MNPLYAGLGGNAAPNARPLGMNPTRSGPLPDLGSLFQRLRMTPAQAQQEILNFPLPLENQAMPGVNVPVPEQTGPMRNRRLQITPTFMNDMQSAPSQVLDLQDSMREFGMGGPLDLNVQEQPGRPMGPDEYDTMIQDVMRNLALPLVGMVAPRDGITQKSAGLGRFRNAAQGY